MTIKGGARKASQAKTLKPKTVVVHKDYQVCCCAGCNPTNVASVKLSDGLLQGSFFFFAILTPALAY